MGSWWPLLACVAIMGSWWPLLAFVSLSLGYVGLSLGLVGLSLGFVELRWPMLAFRWPTLAFVGLRWLSWACGSSGGGGEGGGESVLVVKYKNKTKQAKFVGSTLAFDGPSSAPREPMLELGRRWHLWAYIGRRGRWLSWACIAVVGLCWPSLAFWLWRSSGRGLVVYVGLCEPTLAIVSWHWLGHRGCWLSWPA